MYKIFYKNKFFYLMLSLLLLGLSVFSQARELDPIYSYQRQGDPSSERASTPAQVFSYYQDIFGANNQCPKSVSGLSPFGDNTINGRPQQLIGTITYDASDAYFSGGTWYYCLPGVQDIIINTTVECPAGTTQSTKNSVNQIVTCIDSTVEIVDSCHNPERGNPILVATGAKKQVDVDYESDDGSLSYVRTYRSDNRGWRDNFDRVLVDHNRAVSESLFGRACLPGVGSSTGGNNCFKYSYPASDNPINVSIHRGNRTPLHFDSINGSTSTQGIKDILSPVYDSSGDVASWSVFNATSNTYETYAINGLIQTSGSLGGTQITYHYSNETTPASIAPQRDLLIRVSNNRGKELSFTYDSESRKKTMVAANGGVFEYSYNEASSVTLQGETAVNNLTSVKYPDGNKKRYWYNEQEHTFNTNQPFALTGISDERGIRYATWTYDHQGRAISSEHSGGKDKVSLQFLTGNAVRVTNSLGKQTIYRFEDINGYRRVVSEIGVATPTCLGANKAYTYTTEGWLESKTDWKGVVTRYSYNVLGQEISRTEAHGTPQAQVIQTEWHADFFKPIKIIESVRTTEYTYDAQGRVSNMKTIATID